MAKSVRKPRSLRSDEFASELDLVHSLRSLVEGPLAEKGRSLRVVRELTIGRRIADLVCAIYDKGSDTLPGPLSVRESVVLSALRRGGPTRIDLLERACGLQRRALRDGRTSRLLESELLARRPGGVVAIGAAWPTPKLIAIEAKLHDWRGGISQATSYAAYADCAYLAIPASLIGRRPEIVEACKAASVGLLAVDRRRLRIAWEAPLQQEHDWRREYAVSRLISAAVGGGE